MSAALALVPDPEPEFGDGDGSDSDALVAFVTLLKLRVQGRGELIRAALQHDINDTLADMAGLPEQE